MSFRINTNVDASRSLSALNKTGNELGMRQMRLATGSRINSAADDSAGFHISNKLKAQTRAQGQALSNIGDAKSMLTVAEGGLSTTMDMLQTIKEKAVQAGNDSMGSSERTAIQNQINALTAEVNDVLGKSEFNGTSLFSDTAGSTLSFHVGDKADDTFSVSIGAMGVSTLGIGTVDPSDASAVTSGDNASNVANAAFTGSEASTARYQVTSNGTGGTKLQKHDGTAFQDVAGAGTLADNQSITDGGFSFDIATAATTGEFSLAGTPAGATETVTSSLDVSTSAGASAAITAIDAAIEQVNVAAASLGDSQNRLSFKEQNLETSKTNYEAAHSRIKDADFAQEQMNIVKLQILQQTGTASFSQANAAPQSVLSLF